MAQTLDLKNIEKKVFRLAIFEDGIWEIYLGLTFTLMGFFPVTRRLLSPALNAVLFLGLLLFFAAIALIAKKRISQPRVGLVKLNSGTKKKIKTAHLITVGLVFITFVLLILGENSLLNKQTWECLPQWFSNFNIDLIFALIIVGIFCIVAYSTGTARFYLHGILLGAGNFATTILFAYYDVEFGWPVALAGLIITSIGIFVLAKFIRDYSLPIEEIINGQ